MGLHAGLNVPSCKIMQTRGDSRYRFNLGPAPQTSAYNKTFCYRPEVAVGVLCTNPPSQDKVDIISLHFLLITNNNDDNFELYLDNSA